jgi:hypothetical protein
LDPLTVPQQMYRDRFSLGGVGNLQQVSAALKGHLDGGDPIAN